jgi:hypothetical protein
MARKAGEPIGRPASWGVAYWLTLTDCDVLFLEAAGFHRPCRRRAVELSAPEAGALLCPRKMTSAEHFCSPTDPSARACTTKLEFRGVQCRKTFS